LVRDYEDKNILMDDLFVRNQIQGPDYFLRK